MCASGCWMLSHERRADGRDLRARWDAVPAAFASLRDGIRLQEPGSSVGGIVRESPPPIIAGRASDTVVVRYPDVAACRILEVVRRDNIPAAY